MRVLFLLLAWKFCQSIDLVQHYFQELNDPEFREKRSDTVPTSRIERRCYDYLACEFPIPALELKNVVFWNGTVSLVKFSNGAMNRISDEELEKINQAKPNHLLPTFAQLGFNNYDLIAGPRIQKKPVSESVCQGKWKEVTVYFHGPWEVSNAFHSFNDNSFAILIQAILQGLLVPESNDYPREAYYFKMLFVKDKPTLIYQLLPYLFGSSHIHQAKELLLKGPHCIRSAVFGPPFKPFQKMSFPVLRMKGYQLLREILAQKLHKKQTAFLPPATPTKDNLRPPKVMILTRRGVTPISSPERKLSKQSEEKIRDTFLAYGAQASICCDFSVLNTIEKVLDTFYDVDICFSIHGAQLTNCAFGQPGMVMFELGVEHAYGLDTLMKITFMTFGHYLFYDLRNSIKSTAMPGPGAVLSKQVITDMVELALATWRYSQLETLPRIYDRYQKVLQSPSHKSLPKEYNRNHERPVIPANQLLPQYHFPRSLPQVIAGLSTSEAIFNFETKQVFVDSHKYEKDYQRFLSEYLGFIQKESSSQWLLRDHSHHKIYHNINKTFAAVQQDPTLVDFFKQRKKPRHEFMRVPGLEPYSLPANHREIMLYLNPLTFDSTKVPHHILGPFIEDTYLYCISLPFFKFQLMTQPLREHRGECDLPVLRMKRSGGNDDRLLKDLIL